jgi:rhodanese-related sulfurtransferase
MITRRAPCLLDVRQPAELAVEQVPGVVSILSAG